MPFKFWFLGGMSPGTIKNFHNTSTKLLIHWQMTPSNCFRRMLVRSYEMEKLHWVDWTYSPRNARYLLVETLLRNSLIRQDCYRHSGNQENGTRKLTNLGESKIWNLGHHKYSCLKVLIDGGRNTINNILFCKVFFWPCRYVLKIILVIIITSLRENRTLFFMKWFPKNCYTYKVKKPCRSVKKPSGNKKTVLSYFNRGINVVWWFWNDENNFFKSVFSVGGKVKLLAFV
jgi:hypothetical protein